MPQGRSLDLTLQFGRFPDAAAHRRVLTRANAMKWMGAALDTAAEIAVRVVGEEEGRALNGQFRRKDYATNVLTFNYARSPMLMADIVLCGPVVQREAVEQGKPLRDHYAHLLVHGTLHAQGYDHETSERDAFTMEALEILVLASLGVPNPY
jgi:probable rRNA maturation factor